MKSILISALFFWVCSQGAAQSHYVQCLVIGLENEEQCRTVEDYIKTHSDIISVRLDSFSGNLLAFLPDGSSYTESHFRQWMQALGFDFYCFQKKVTANTPVQKLTRSGCVNEKHK